MDSHEENTGFTTVALSYILLLSKSRQNLDEFDPDRTAYGSYDHRVVWGSYASSDNAALPQQEVLDSRAVLYSESDMSALMDCQYIEEIPSFPEVICRIRTSSLGF